MNPKATFFKCDCCTTGKGIPVLYIFFRISSNIRTSAWVLVYNEYQYQVVNKLVPKHYMASFKTQSFN